ncbi:RNA-binding cell elongation regulator Jag/EloR [Mahella sp.]|uniref:RNA-binding cell elongation regulator Jag/EloR n=1 Tax=Mahella sp. TaxID=2798721 RepID=UPI0025BDA375|nr:RNA-binding cell elongation regulator Jag/EloR [Mahella sp.]MBZ4665217.1 single-stranded nucleic acid binding protein [Mahella sp.]
MRFVEATGRTEEEAIQSALDELNVSRDDVDIEVLEPASKGILGLWGSKPAKVKVTVKDKKADKAKEFLEGVIERMKVDASIVVEQRDDGDVIMNIEGVRIGRLIGHRGETLDALQYLANLACNRDGEEQGKIILDAENYRKKREQALVDLAFKMADKVKRTHRRVVLEPMSAYERRILHTALQDDPDVTTYSEGMEPRRKVVITLK